MNQFKHIPLLAALGLLSLPYTHAQDWAGRYFEENPDGALWQYDPKTDTVTILGEDGLFRELYGKFDMKIYKEEWEKDFNRVGTYLDAFLLNLKSHAPGQYQALVPKDWDPGSEELLMALARVRNLVGATFFEAHTPYAFEPQKTLTYLTLTYFQSLIFLGVREDDARELSKRFPELYYTSPHEWKCPAGSKSITEGLTPWDAGVIPPTQDEIPSDDYTKFRTLQWGLEHVISSVKLVTDMRWVEAKTKRQTWKGWELSYCR